MTERKYPVGIQTFSEIIREGYVYVDKTDIVWQLVKYAKFTFLSRPRRFGKGVYNPFSLMKCSQQQKIASFWFESGTPSFLIQQMKDFNTNITEMDDLEVPASAFDQPTENMHDVLPLLYQSGYLTIKGYDRESELYTLSIPNQEVRIGFTDGLLPAYIGIQGSQVQTGFALKFWRALEKNDVDLAIREMQSYLARAPYKTDGRRIVKVGIKFNAESRTIEEWKITQILRHSPYHREGDGVLKKMKNGKYIHT